MKEVDSLALANVQMHLERHIRIFQESKDWLSKIQIKTQEPKSYTTNVVNGNIQVEDHRIKLPKLKWIRMKNIVILQKNIA